MEVREEQIRGEILWDYFDRASNPKNIYGAGFVIHANIQKYFKALAGLGSRTNNFAKLQSLKLLHRWLMHLGMGLVQIFGDSQNFVK